MRKAFAGWRGLVKGGLEEDPWSGSLFVVVNRRGHYVQVLYGDRTGLCLWAQRWERGRFRFPREGRTQEVSAPVWQVLLEGIELGDRHKRWYPLPLTLAAQVAALSQAELSALLRKNQAREQQKAELHRQVEWFKRQLFGQKSARRLLAPDVPQLPLPGLRSASTDPAHAPPPPLETVKAYQRRSRADPRAEAAAERGLRFERSVPVEVIELSNPALAGLPAEA